MIDNANEKWYTFIKVCPKCKNETFYYLYQNNMFYCAQKYRCLFCRFEKTVNI